MQKTYRLGIIGTGRIAHRFVPEANIVEEIEVVAVYNPRLSSAKKFAEELQIEYYTDDLEMFRKLIDVVYIASPHETHVEYCRQMLFAEKHVLCEKPLAFSKKDAEVLFALAKEKKCVLMEGIKTAYCPGFQALLGVVRSGKIGQIIDVEACFSRLCDSKVRELTDVKHGGSFTEFGTYSLLPIVKILGTQSEEIDFWSIKGETGVDAYTKANVDYKTATGIAKTGLGVKSEGQLVVAGTKGYILAPSPWWLTRYFEVRYEDPTQVEKYEFKYEGDGLRYEIKAFVEQIKGAVDRAIVESESIWLAKQMEDFLRDRRM